MVRWMMSKRLHTSSSTPLLSMGKAPLKYRWHHPAARKTPCQKQTSIRARSVDPEVHQIANAHRSYSASPLRATLRGTSPPSSYSEWIRPRGLPYIDHPEERRRNRTLWGWSVLEEVTSTCCKVRTAHCRTLRIETAVYLGHTPRMLAVTESLSLFLGSILAMRKCGPAWAVLTRTLSGPGPRLLDPEWMTVCRKSFKSLPSY